VNSRAFQPQRTSRDLGLWPQHLGIEGVPRIAEHPDISDPWHGFLKDCHPLTGKLRAIEGDARYVSPGMRQTGYDAAAQWIARRPHNDRDSFGRLLRGDHRRRP
jgi:hypothetical protein